MEPVDVAGKRIFWKNQSKTEKTDFIYLDACFWGGEALIRALITHWLDIKHKTIFRNKVEEFHQVVPCQESLKLSCFVEEKSRIPNFFVRIRTSREWELRDGPIFIFFDKMSLN